MASLTIRQLDEEIKSKLRLQAARHGHSMEAEARVVLAQALNHDNEPTMGIASRIVAIVKESKSVDLAEVNRTSKPSRRQLDFSDKAYG